ncbi:hypothetical protein INS49_011903 [Diaporthe citri]|uniref:uncharacterized protein n=1 Tax=Diaporthe citri TaxID=83186 RepID=UPI001C7F2AAD|nr:uncharacterized protein INS49_011903 [Diaporthe citri]KAG6360836.1 hypothetical protein INS49_011903 [Diaporthe citri]
MLKRGKNIVRLSLTLFGTYHTNSTSAAAIPQSLQWPRLRKTSKQSSEYEAMISTIDPGSLQNWQRGKSGEPCDHESQDCSRVGILQSLLGKLDGAASIEAPFSVLYGCNTIIGKSFYGNTGLAIDDSAFVTIGDDVLIGPGVNFITINHSTEVALRLQGVMYAKPITIGSACWIGARVTILPGATIGYGCTVGAGAVVSGSIPEYSVAVGFRPG